MQCLRKDSPIWLGQPANCGPPGCGSVYHSAAPAERLDQDDLAYDRDDADDSTTGIRSIIGTDEAANDAERDLTVPAASICHVVHAEEVVVLQLHRDNLERLLASGSFFWIDLPRPSKEDFAVLGASSALGVVALTGQKARSRLPSRGGWRVFRNGI